MGALIILHGLFLLSCNKNLQQCQIVVASADPHLYKVGVNLNLVDIPLSTTMTTTLANSVGNDPYRGTLDQRELVLDSSIVSLDATAASRIITVPMPDDIYGANRLKPFREDVLNGTDPMALISQAGSDNRVTISETILLSYRNAGKFKLVDMTKEVQDSQTINGVEVLAFYSWPATCGPHPDHTGGLNRILKIRGANPTFKFSEVGVIVDLDESGSGTFNLPDSVLRPPCIMKTSFLSLNPKSQRQREQKPRKGSQLPQDSSSVTAKANVELRTATETGCGAFILYI